MKPHIGHYIVGAVGIIAACVVIVAGKGNVVVEVATAIGTAAGAVALVLRSIRSAPGPAEKKDGAP